jgi:hypothetical protein
MALKARRTMASPVLPVNTQGAPACRHGEAPPVANRIAAALFFPGSLTRKAPEWRCRLDVA